MNSTLCHRQTPPKYCMVMLAVDVSRGSWRGGDPKLGRASAEVVLGALYSAAGGRKGPKISSKTERATLVECGLQPGKSRFVSELIFPPRPREVAILVSDCKSG